MLHLTNLRTGEEAIAPAREIWYAFKMHWQKTDIPYIMEHFALVANGKAKERLFNSGTETFLIERCDYTTLEYNRNFQTETVTIELWHGSKLIEIATYAMGHQEGQQIAERMLEEISLKIGLPVKHDLIPF